MNQRELLNKIRRKRLPNDYQEMCNLRGSILDWTILKGQAPHVESYQLQVNIKTIISDEPSYRNKHQLKLSLPTNYPKSAPIVQMLSSPYPFHPNWFEGGRWCFGNWDMSEGLGYYVVRMLRILQYDKGLTDPNDPANTRAKDWYLRYKDTALFPCDTQELPDPTGESKLFKPQSKIFKINGPKDKGF